MLVLLVEQLLLIITTHWILIQLVWTHTSQLMPPWLLVLYSIHVLLHEHLAIRVYHVSIIDYTAILVFFLSRKTILLWNLIVSFHLVLLKLLLGLLSFEIVLLIFLVVIRVFHLII
jgi:hypothetical protein